MSDAPSGKPTTVLIAAMGGEGGGVLTNWLVAAATKAGRIVHSTSIPGVAQRTGATTYYVEIWPEGGEGQHDAAFALYPTPGEIDLMVASELLEAGRAAQNGFVSPDRTTLIASTHRVFSMDEKIAMADGRFDADRIEAAANELARQPILVDLEAASRRSGAPISAVMLGAIAGSGGTPIPEQAFRDAIQDEGKAVEANLAGFDAGRALAAEGDRAKPDADVRTAPATRKAKLLSRAQAFEPAPVRDIVVEGVRRLVDYQDAAYAQRYLDRLDPIVAADNTPDRRVTLETARYLALQMSYEDIIRVAQLKVRPERMARIRAEIGAAPSEPVKVVEFLKPGLREACALLPGPIARPVLGWATRRGVIERWHVGIRINSASISGFLLLKLLSWLRPLRRLGYRYGEDQRRIDHWLSLIESALPLHAAFAGRIAETARLIKGYGDTFERGLGNYDRILAALVEPVIAARTISDEDAERLHAACEAALADASGGALDDAIPTGQTPPIETQTRAAE